MAESVYAPLAARGVVTVAGPEARAFLQNLITQDLDRIGEEGAAYGALLTPQGRMISDMRVYQRGTFVLVDVPPGLGSALASRFAQCPV